jgi:hypothetical protein
LGAYIIADLGRRLVLAISIKLRFIDVAHTIPVNLLYRSTRYRPAFQIERGAPCCSPGQWWPEEEKAIGHSEYDPAAKERRPWNAGRMVGAKGALKP